MNPTTQPSVENTLLTFSVNSIQEILDRGGDYDWPVDQERTKKCQYLVCCSSQGSNRGDGFLVGKISGIQFTYVDKNGKNRYLISISEYSSIASPRLWPGHRNPIHYTSLEDLNIDLASLKFEKVSKPVSESLTIAQAKSGLAKQYGVSEDSIEITIKG
jgi:hypothetical protein